MLNYRGAWWVKRTFTRWKSTLEAVESVHSGLGKTRVMVSTDWAPVLLSEGVAMPGGAEREALRTHGEWLSLGWSRRLWRGYLRNGCANMVYRRVERYDRQRRENWQQGKRRWGEQWRLQRRRDDGAVWRVSKCPRPACADQSLVRRSCCAARRSLCRFGCRSGFNPETEWQMKQCWNTSVIQVLA